MKTMNAVKGCCAGCLGMIVAMGLAFACVAALLYILGYACMTFGLGEDGDSDVPESKRAFTRIWVSGDGDEDDPKVLRVKIGGVISDAQEDILWYEKSSAAEALKKIRAATYDYEIQGLYLVIDSPGGEVTLSDVIADAVRRFKKEKMNRFVLVEMGAVCCSGGYYIAAGADYIIAHPTTITGSIGVVMSTVNAAELAKKIGVESVVIATGANKSMLDPLKPVDTEHVKIFKKAVDSDYERFLSIVSEGRHIPVDSLRPIADGRILCADEAMKLKLIDAIGYSEESEVQLAKMAKSENIRIVRYKDEHSLRDLFEDTFVSSSGMGRALQRAATRGRAIKLNFIAE